MARGLVISDSYGLRVRRQLASHGLDIYKPRPGATIQDVLDLYLGPDRDWDRPADPYQLHRYEVSSH